MSIVSKFDLWMYRITTYVIYPLYIFYKIFEAVFTYDVRIKIAALVWATLASIIFFGLHKKWKFSFYIHYLPLFFLMVGAVGMAVFIPDYFNKVGGLDGGLIFYSVICISLLLLSIFLMYKWWDVKPLFYLDDGKEVNNSVIIRLKEKLSFLVNYCIHLGFSCLGAVLAISIPVLPIYATVVDAKADRIAWAAIDIVCFPLGFIRGICFLFGWM